MSRLMIQASTHDYEVIVESGIRHRFYKQLPKDYKTILIITDSNLSELCLEEVVEHLSPFARVETAIVPAGESSKSMEQYSFLLDACIEAKLDRKSLIVALGGGMIGDLAGFTASTYLRGVDFVQMPTTILAHDSSVGGKVAINHSRGKNLIGSFYNPVQVIYDLDLLNTLPDPEIRSGYGEVIKHAFLSDENWLIELFNRKLLNNKSDDVKEDLVRGIQVKADIVEKDERETDIRKFLNLGHTLAHAIESEIGYGGITHGEAVAVGIWFALKLSEVVEKVNLPVKDYVNWLVSNDYPLNQIKHLSAETLVERMKWDKKTEENTIYYVLLSNIGNPVVRKIDDAFLHDQLSEFLKEVNHL